MFLGLHRPKNILLDLSLYRLLSILEKTIDFIFHFNGNELMKLRLLFLYYSVAALIFAPLPGMNFAVTPLLAVENPENPPENNASDDKPTDKPIEKKEINLFDGLWKSVDEKTGKSTSIIKIKIDKDGNLKGYVYQLFLKVDEDPNPVCEMCDGEKKNAPILGLEVLWDFITENKKNDTTWKGGKILDPKSGKVYSCNLSLDESGNKLLVHKFFGISFMGKTETWIRFLNTTENK